MNFELKESLFSIQREPLFTSRKRPSHIEESTSSFFQSNILEIKLLYSNYLPIGYIYFLEVFGEVSETFSIQNPHQCLNAITPLRVYEMQMTIIGTNRQCKGKEDFASMQ